MKGLLVSIYRDGFGDCTNGGVSARVKQAVITGDLVDCDVFESTALQPEMVIVERNIGRNTYLHAVPKDLLESGKWTMFGGNFLYSSDSRFPSDQPIAIHDRVE